MSKKEQSDYNALFNPETEVSSDSSSVTDEYKPSAEKGKNNVYQAIIRFIPWYKDPKHGSLQDKWTSWLVDPVTDRGRFVDCPSSVGKPSQLQDMYWKLKKSESVTFQKKAQIFSRRHSFSTLIQVIKDENNSDLEGKILVYRFGVKIWEKINAELKPVIGEKHDPYDILQGKAFALVITKVSGYNNYDQSKFVDKRIPLCIPNEEEKLKPITPDNDKKKVFEWVKENSPNLEKYSYQEWDSETQDYVNQVINAVTGETVVPTNTASVVNKKDDGGANVSDKVANDEISSKNISTEDIGDDDGDSLELPDLDDDKKDDDDSDSGISGDLDDVMKNL